MPPETATLETAGVPARRWHSLPAHWRAALIRAGAVMLALIAVFHDDWAAMGRQWWDISTYNHIILIPPILGWLVWQRRAELVRLMPEAWWPGLIPMSGAAFLWVLGAFSGLDLARQAGAVAMLGSAVPLLLGPRVTAGLFFPLCYMAFLVPFGEELVEALQTITAEITIALTHLSGIPATVDGVFIDTPAGLFEVAEACSGVKFLIAMIAFGTLAANVCFVSWKRRSAMMAACLVVPILANGVRAWGTIYAAQIVGVEKAAGFDHIVYGWFFFAIVLALVIAGAWRFFDRPLDGPMIDTDAIARSRVLAWLDKGRISGIAAIVGFAVVVVAAQSWAFAAETLDAPLPQAIEMPQVAGWHRVDYAPAIWWGPRAEGADHRLLGRYADGEGHSVDVFIALYAGQGEGREAGGFGQGALTPSSPWSWQAPGPAFRDARSERLLGHGKVERLAVTWFHTGDLLTGSNARLKLAIIGDHLVLRARPTTMLILSSEDYPGHRAAQSIARFIAATGPVDSWMDRITALR
ncbi:exosortase A [Novosphingobium sp. ST904]|uniref:exosortase A n=1 Tax=Novosphingobium sp. ST904 TaxID=1684385 RepID=UPI0006C86913|nr:exosortase A [Novosphingobium sp. ST904]KPH61666.1 ABC transporter [Novosphingobium sp. ST904]TCM40734.1 exosortase A [Novosphingobium sp. ST904]